ncbi:hypothetical protein CCPUN_06560 [Cardinium endosymbiont of Culicoides punctatus]|nr:hypothetical protein CCPUN_06560 [Cardinium endosymbiont of Culicoides punctatus]
MDKYYYPKNKYNILDEVTEQTVFQEIIQCRIIGLVGKILIFNTSSGNKLISLDKLIGKTAITISKS